MSGNVYGIPGLIRSILHDNVAHTARINQLRHQIEEKKRDLERLEKIVAANEARLRSLRSR